MNKINETTRIMIACRLDKIDQEIKIKKAIIKDKTEFMQWREIEILMLQSEKDVLEGIQKLEVIQIDSTDRCDTLTIAQKMVIDPTFGDDPIRRVIGEKLQVYIDQI